MICVDDAFFRSTQDGQRNLWCHLFSESPDDPAAIQGLHRFAEIIGLRREWFQDHITLPHYDVTERMREKAIRYGAQPVPLARTTEVMERMRELRLKQLDEAIASPAVSPKNAA